MQMRRETTQPGTGTGGGNYQGYAATSGHQSRSSKGGGLIASEKKCETTKGNLTSRSWGKDQQAHSDFEEDTSRQDQETLGDTSKRI